VQTSNIAKVYVQNVLHVLEYKVEDMDATALSLVVCFSDGNVPTLQSGATSAGRRHKSGCNTRAPAAFLKSHSIDSIVPFILPQHFN